MRNMDFVDRDTPALIFIQGLWVLFLTVLLLGVPRLAGAFADLFDYAAIDPDGAFARGSVRHIVQAVVFLVLMLIIMRVSALRFGFGWGDSKVGLHYVRLFALIFAGYTVVSLIIVLATGTFQRFPYPLTARNIVGQLGFQLLLSGPSEELIFRAFAMTMLVLLVKGTLVDGDTGFAKHVTTIFSGAITAANFIAAIIFALAHVRFAFAPFSLSFNTGQLIYAGVLGLFYGVCYERSKSMVYPMLMHSMSNVVAVSVTIIAAFLIR
jgi:uncharacterized protein